jgi:hypothetical protein
MLTDRQSGIIPAALKEAVGSIFARRNELFDQYFALVRSGGSSPETTEKLAELNRAIRAEDARIRNSRT